MPRSVGNHRQGVNLGKSGVVITWENKNVPLSLLVTLCRIVDNGFMQAVLTNAPVLSIYLDLWQADQSYTSGRLLTIAQVSPADVLAVRNTQ